MDAFKSHVIYRFHGFVLDVRNRKLSHAAHEIKLSSRAFDTLVELVQHRGETLSKDHLMNTVWRGLVVEENNINQAICQVRKALGNSSGESAFVKTISGKGFCFVADVQVEAEVETSAIPVHVNVEDELAALISAPATPAHNSQPHPFAAQNIWRTHWKQGAALVITAVLSLLGFVKVREVLLMETVSVSDQQSADSATSVEDRSIMPDSIAVMPFADLNENSDNSLFALGLHDELINQLAKVGTLQVISRDNVIAASESGASLSEIAQQLKVESLLTGSILVVGERARINLQMLNAATGVALWSNSVEFDTQSLSEMISAQGDIALKVVNALEVEASLPQANDLASLPSQSFEAHRYYLTARNSYNHQDEEEKWVLIGKALELDPDYADAQLMFANINLALAVTPMQGYTHNEHLELAETSVDAYLRLEPAKPQGYALKSGVLAARGDWKAAVEHLQKLDELNPSYADMKYSALVKMSLGHFDDAVRIYEDTLMNDPSNLYARGLLMAANEMAGDEHGARQEYLLGNELKSEWWGRTVNVLLTLGRREPLDPTNTLTDFPPELRHLLINLHDPVTLKRGVKKYMESDKQNARDDVFYSALAVYYGDIDKANTLLRGSIEKVSTSVFWAWLPVFADVRSTPEFRQLLVDTGIVDYWQQHGWPELCRPQDASFACD